MTADEAEGNTDTDDKEDELGWEVGGNCAPREDLIKCIVIAVQESGG